MPRHDPRQENPYMPLQLKGLLARHQIRQADWAAAVLQACGKPLGETAASLLVARGIWPRNTPPHSIRQQTADYLRSRGVPEDEIASAFDLDEPAQANGRPVRGSLLSNAAALRKATAPTPTDLPTLENEMLHPEAKRHFRLFRDPFKDDVSSVDDVFLAPDQRYVAEAMLQTARHGGFLAVVGESGSGKTTLRKLMTERLRPQPVRMVFPRVIDKSRLTTGSICQAIINDLAPEERVRASLESQARQVEKILRASSAADYQHVLVIEEAHDLSIATLKYLKRFYEIEDGFRKLLAIVLIGQPELKLLLDEQRHPEAREVIRRIEIAELAPVATNAEDYLSFKFQRAGGDVKEVFAPDAYDVMRTRWTRTDTSGRTKTALYPLFLNNLAVRSMNRAAELGVPVVNGDVIRSL